MGHEKEGARNGGYVGSFLHLFDWRTKSRKKFVSNKSDFPELEKQAKKKGRSLMVCQANQEQMDEDERADGSIGRASCDQSCSSSGRDDDRCGTRAPGVVARLMGLDSLPTCSFSENFMVAPRHKEKLTMAMEKFQTEILPPRSAKSISITRHKLLSPIKNPGFVPSQTSAHIMEVASKMIEPRATSKSELNLAGSSSPSIPLNVRHLREKMKVGKSVIVAKDLKQNLEDSQKASASNSARCHGRNSSNKIQAFSRDFSGVRVEEEEDESAGFNNKAAKSVSLAVQAKVNVQRRELYASAGHSREPTNGLPFHDQLTSQRNLHKKSALNSAAALKQNNQKQNGAADEDKAKPPAKQGRKAAAVTTSSKNGCRKLSLEDGVSHGNGNAPRKKKRSMEKNQVVHNILIDDCWKAIGSDTGTTDRNYSWAREINKKGMDVVSFTFTSPLTQPMPHPDHKKLDPKTPQLKKGGISIDSQEGDRLWSRKDSMKKMTSTQNNGINGDALASLLEQKLRELSEKHAKVDAEPIFNMGSNKKDKSSGNNHGSNPRFQGGDEEDRDDHSSKPDNSQSNMFHGRHLSPVSVLESSSLSTDSYSSSDSRDSSSNTQGKAAIKETKVHDSHGNADAELLSDSGSSTSTRPEPTAAILAGSTTWESECVKKTIQNLGCKFQDIALGRAGRLADCAINYRTNAEEQPQQKLFLECLDECLDSKYQRFYGGGFKMWQKGIEAERLQEELARSIEKEISSWREMQQHTIDEVVEKDMSSKEGRWVDFEVDAFLLATDIESRLLNSLISEIIDDMT